MSSIKEEWVHETQFGKWFLRTGVWVKYVLDLAIVRLCKLAGDDVKQNARVLDVGCGFGQSLAIIERHLKPKQLIAVDVDPQVLPAAARCAPPERRPGWFCLHRMAQIRCRGCLCWTWVVFVPCFFGLSS